ncbi:MAG TPA: hypothetical protein VF943_11540 [Burkholderiales bacterium]
MRGLLLVLLLAGCSSPRELVHEKGVSPEQFQKDKRECTASADRAAAMDPLRTPREKSQVRNRVMLDCLRGRGYDLKN